MWCRCGKMAAILIAVWIALSIPRATADLIRLKNGGEIRGKINRQKVPSDDDQVTIETLSGGVVVVAHNQVQFITRRPLLVEQYEARAKVTPDTLDAQWELAEWCRQKRLKAQREIHLRRIIELDPEHERAHRGLGHSKRNGKWMTRHEAMTERGYVRYKGRYVTPQELELIEKSNALLQAEREWYKKVRLWRAWLTGRSAQRSQLGFAELQRIKDPDAVSALARNFSDDKDRRVRMMYVSILGQIPGPKPVPVLVDQSLNDADYEIRYSSLNAISSDQFETATAYYLRELRNDQNVIVRRAAVALGRVGNKNAVPKLIEALTTKHKYRVRVPDDRGSLSFRSDGAFGSSAGRTVLPPQIEGLLRTGQLPNGVIVHNPQVNQLARYKTITIRYEHKNAEVLAALQKLTGESFGYDKRTWRLWWVAEKNGAGKVAPLP